MSTPKLTLAAIDYLLRLVTVEGAMDQESRHLEAEDSAVYVEAIEGLEAMRATMARAS